VADALDDFRAGGFRQFVENLVPQPAVAHPGSHFHEFVVVERPGIPAAPASCSGMFSCHVFQHFPDFAGVRAYLIEAFRVLRPGGTVCFHIPVMGAHLGSTQSSARLELRNLRAKLGRRLHIGKKWEYHRYNPRRIIALLTHTGFRDIELRIFPMHSNGDHHSYFLARKP